MFFYSPDIKKDAHYLEELFDNKDKSLKLMYYKEKDEYLPSRIRISYNNIDVAVIINEISCNSYNNISTIKNKVLRIGTLETIIHLFYAFYFFTKYEKPYLCDIGKCVDLFYDITESKISIFKPFSISCSGYQKGYPTLLHEKIERIKKKKNSTLKKK